MSRSLALVLVALLVACPAEPGPDTQAGSSGGSTAAMEGSSTGSTGAATTSPTTGGPPGDAECPVRPYGQWASCAVDNTACGWMDSGKSGELTCLSPAGGGGYNVCAIKGCVDDCDCFLAPPTGDAVVFCAELTKGGEKACTLYCAGGQTCPDGMSCQSGYCFWDG